MSIFKRYLDHLKHNPEGYWFKRKLYGWGWTPARWQGWASILFYVFTIIFLFTRVDARSHSGSDTLLGVALPFMILTILFIALCYAKGESPRWQWGEDYSEDKHENT